MTLPAGDAFRRLIEGRRLEAVYYVNTVSGNDSNNGTSPGSPKLTLAAAQALLPAQGGTIRIKAPSAYPVVGWVSFSTGHVTLESMDDDYWYVERVTTYTSSWTSQGSNIYSRSDGGVTSTLLFVPSQTDADGFQRMLVKNTVTPTTPAAGEFGQSGGNYYVHLVGDENPNSHTIKRASTAYLFQSTGTCFLTVRNCVGRYTGSGGAFTCGSTTASLQVENCIAQYSEGIGFSSSGGFLIAKFCVSHKHVNDGFSTNGGFSILEDCEAAYNTDEGLGAHTAGVTYVVRGRYHHNNSAGLSAVNSNTKMYVQDAVVDYNGAKNQAGIERHGIVYDTGTSGTLSNVLTENNTGSGFYCNGGTVTQTNVTSRNNSEADDPC